MMTTTSHVSPHLRRLLRLSCRLAALLLVFNLGISTPVMAHGLTRDGVSATHQTSAQITVAAVVATRFLPRLGGRACTAPSRTGILSGSMVVGTFAGKRLHRTYLLYVPHHSAPGNHYGLRLHFHGTDSDTTRIEAQNRNQQPYAEQQHYIIAYPDNVPSIGGFDSLSGYNFDVDFTRHLILYLAATMNSTSTSVIPRMLSQ